MTTLAHLSGGRDSRAAREALTISAAGPHDSLALYELSGDVRVDGGVRSETAVHRFLDRRVSIHRLPPAARAQRHYAFVQSIHAQANLRHPGVAQVLDAGIHEDVPYAVIERPDGTTLDEHLDWAASKPERIDAREALRTVIALAEVLEHAHARGARVYSLAPSNILLTEDGVPVVLQLGLADLADGLHEPAARAGFSAPELASGSASDERSDIYALGMLLQHILTAGRAPADAPLPAESVTGVYAEGLRAVIRRATARRPGDRYPSASALRRDLTALLEAPAAAVRLATAAHEQEGPLLEREVGGAGWTHAARPAPAAVTMPAPPAAAGLPVQDPRDVPGADRAEFQSALPYTVLVPSASASEASAPAASAPQQRMSSATLTLLSVLLVVAVALGAALMLG